MLLAPPSPLIQTAFVLLVAFFVDKFVTLRRVVARLKDQHRSVWVELGSPEAFTSLMSSRRDLYLNFSGRMSLTLWLSRGNFRELNDPVISKLAAHMAFIRIGAMVVAMTFFLAVVWLHRNE
jgi:hypothetical protein